MIQNYKRLALQIEEINNKNVKGAQIQKIMSSSRFIAFQLRSPGKTHYLYLGRGKGHEGLWEGEAPIESNLRVKDKFLDYLRSYMINRRIKQINLDKEDRIIEIQFLENNNDRFMFFYRGRELFFANSDLANIGNKTFTSWDGAKDFDPNLIFNVFNEIGRKNIPQSEANAIVAITDLLELEKEAQESSLNKISSKVTKKINKKLENIQNDIKKIQKWRDLLKVIETEDLSSYPKKTKICGYKFTFAKEQHYSRCSQIHDKVKKLKAVEIFMSARLVAEENKEIKILAQVKNILTPIAPVWKEKRIEARESKKEEQSLDFKIISHEGFDIGVGKSAKGNDQLRNTWGKKEDWWIHADESPSAHVVIKIKDPSIDLLEILPYTKGYFTNSSEIDVMYTKLKNVKSVKGSAGKVLVKKEKRIRLKDD